MMVDTAADRADAVASVPKGRHVGMSRIYKFTLDLPDIEVEASSPEEALTLADQQREQYASSNDGSELISNAGLIPKGFYDCEHEDTRTNTHYSSRRQSTAHKEEYFIRTTVTCNKCRKVISTVEVPTTERPAIFTKTIYYPLD